jgi:hypothetical protein
MNNELLTEFIHTEMNFKLSISVKTYEIIGSKVHLHFIDNNMNLAFGEFFELQRYNNWYQNKIKNDRDQKLKELGI